MGAPRRPRCQEAVISTEEEPQWVTIELRLHATADQLKDLASTIGDKFIYKVSAEYGCTLQAPHFEGEQPVDFDEEAEMTTLALFCSMIQYKTNLIKKRLNTHILDLEVK